MLSSSAFWFRVTLLSCVLLRHVPVLVIAIIPLVAAVIVYSARVYHYAACDLRAKYRLRVFAVSFDKLYLYVYVSSSSSVSSPHVAYLYGHSISRM